MKQDALIKKRIEVIIQLYNIVISFHLMNVIYMMAANTHLMKHQVPSQEYVHIKKNSEMITMLLNNVKNSFTEIVSIGYIVNKILTKHRVLK